MISNFPQIKLLMPEKLLTTDNAVMIGIAGFIQASLYPEKLSTGTQLAAKGNLSISSPL
jgi:tRNA A37 threonylcarbamoyltransferase TsaD